MHRQEWQATRRRKSRKIKKRKRRRKKSHICLVPRYEGRDVGCSMEGYHMGGDNVIVLQLTLDEDINFLLKYCGLELVYYTFLRMC